MQDVDLSHHQVLVGLYLIAFGIVTYYFIPLAVITSDQGLLFLVLNLVMTSLLLGLVFLISLVAPACQRAFLECMLGLCCRKDRPLGPVLRKRLESAKDRNMKIALMITCSVCFILY